MNSMVILWISLALTVMFFAAIVIVSVYSYVRQRMEIRISQQLEGMIATAFSLEEGQRLLGIDKLRQYVGRSVRRKEQLIHVLLRQDEAIVAGNNGTIVELIEATAIDAYLTKLFDSKSAYKQSLACRYAGDLKLESMQGRILALCNSRDNDVIYHVMLALAKLGDQKGLSECLRSNSDNISLSFRAVVEVITVFAGSKEQLIKDTIDHSDDYLKGILIKAAADEKCEGLTPYYVKYLNSKDKNLRIACIRALSESPSASHEQYMIAMLDDREWEVRAAAAKSLSKIGTNKSLEPLEKTVGDKEWWVRQNAASAIIAIPGGRQYAKRIVNGSDRFASEAISSILEMTS